MSEGAARLCCAVMRTCVYMYMYVFVPCNPNYVGTTVHGVCDVLCKLCAG